MAESHLSVADVRPLRISASRSPTNLVIAGPVEVDSFAPSIDFEFSISDENTTGFGLRLGISAEFDGGEFEVQMFGVFESPDHSQLTNDEFEPLLREALRLLFPFARSEILDISSRVFSSGILAPPIDFSNTNVNLDFRARHGEGD